jgi:hemolysin activation/secretion protein
MVNFEFNIPEIAGTDDNLNELGRNGADDSWATMQWDVTQSFYLEPLIARKAWLDPQNGRPTLAHEVAFTFKGQYAFDNRLIPNFEQVAGGMYTVRGYPESAAAGDGVIIGSVEYRFHVPRAMKWNPEPGTLFGQPFRWRPQQPYGSADWDLVLRGFFDVGRTIVSDAPNAEEEETLMGAGIGMELLYKRNFNIRADWGFVLNRLETDDVDVGDSRFHILATILF